MNTLSGLIAAAANSVGIRYDIKCLQNNVQKAALTELDMNLNCQCLVCRASNENNIVSTAVGKLINFPECCTDFYLNGRNDKVVIKDWIQAAEATNKDIADGNVRP